MKYKIKNLRWALADRLSYWACLLRGHKWHLVDTRCGVPGNRASELEQQIWMSCVTLMPARETDWDALNGIESKLSELSQMAGANWGHYPLPKK